MSNQKSTTLTTRAGRWVFFDEPSDTKSDYHPNEIPSTKSSQPVERHPEFFFDNTLVAIQIGTTLFNVHKYQLAKSEVFSDMFKMPKPEDNIPEEGSSPEHPIRLEGVSASDFAALLRVLYASLFSDDHPTPETSLVIPAFRLANMFNFTKLRSHLLPLAEQNLDDVDKIVFAREFDIKNWLVPAHVRLCQRKKPLSDEEANKLGVRSVLIISRMREQHQGPLSSSIFTTNCFYCSICTSMTETYGSSNCDGCGTYGRLLRYCGSGRIAQFSADLTNNDAEIEAGVNKWVEDGFIVKD
ncbi:hypothetical protein B0J17DRAFT_660622 [Rhizoctonia solani]|nr:hypothetical protein B0J17DRAFT_660622 [Rhizoctonia solani]